MTMLPASRSFALTALSLCVAVFPGCATLDQGRPASQAAAPAAGAITDFSAGLRCMDNLLLDYGTGELPVTVEDGPIEEPLISALTDMSRRSRLVRRQCAMFVEGLDIAGQTF